jgi:hypothetical protein
MKHKVLLLAAVVLVGVVALAAGPFEEWQKSGHADRQLAVEEATVEHRGTLAAHCARCHAKQGFIVYLQQLANGDTGWIKGPDGKNASVEYLRELGLTEETVEPITCTACHQEDNFQLRVQGDTPLLPAGFAAQGVGEGALCMTCHNTRNGRVSWDATEVGRYSAPHHSAQADVIMGKNVYFLDDTQDGASPHATFTEDSCVTCHLKLGQEGHAFEASEAVCASCHGPSLAIEFVQEPTEHLLAQLKDTIAQKALEVREQIASVNAWDPETDEFTETSIDGSQITSLEEILSIHGQISFKFLLADGSEVYSELRDIKGATGEVVYALSDPIVRAAWNYLLIEFDGSSGVHNPGFARNVLLATLNALR